MKALAIFLLLAPFLLPAQENPTDSPETLKWVQQQGVVIEKGLRYATISQYGPDLMRRIQESEKNFRLVSMSSIQCEEARHAADRGLKLCNLLDAKSDADINGLIERATKARIEALNMQTAAGYCLQKITPLVDLPDLTRADVFIASVSIARNDINYGLKSGDARILAISLEHAIRLLGDAGQMASTIDGCIAYREASQQAIQSCTAGMLSSTWNEIEKHCLVALGHLDVMESEAKCQ